VNMLPVSDELGATTPLIPQPTNAAACSTRDAATSLPQQYFGQDLLWTGTKMVVVVLLLVLG
jgi:hypothetical protein